jgi:hypothetical protein
LINDLRVDERIWRHDQFWFYSYPSGYPYPYSVAIFRQQLDAAERKFPLRKRTVVIGTVWAAASPGCSSPTRAIKLDAESSRDALMRFGDFRRQPNVR